MGTHEILHRHFADHIRITTWMNGFAREYSHTAAGRKEIGNLYSCATLVTGRRCLYIIIRILCALELRNPR